MHTIISKYKRILNIIEKRLVKILLEDLRAGKNLSDSLKKFVGAIDEALNSMILVGENSANIANAFDYALKMFEVAV